MFDGVGKDFGLSFAILLGVLLGTDNDGLRAVHAVDAVYHLIEARRSGQTSPAGWDCLVKYP